jgi:tellurite resistance protein TerC
LQTLGANLSFSAAPDILWGAFAAVVVALLLFDLGVLNRKQHEISAKESLLTYSFYVAVAISFGAWVAAARGAEAGFEFLTAYLLEQSLAMDNMFVIVIIFDVFKIPRIYQRRVLVWGILGAIIFRAILIGLGAALIHAFSWALSLFGTFLILTGIRLLRRESSERFDVERHPILKFLKIRFLITRELHGSRFYIRQSDGSSTSPALQLTPLAVALIMIEVADITFAIDSVPAVFAITQDTFVVYTSNIFAVLGLRALYFALAAAIQNFKYLRQSMAAVLVLIGLKILLVPFGIRIETWISLVVTVAILGGGALYSLLHDKDTQR